jgi:hypothetical protein
VGQSRYSNDDSVDRHDGGAPLHIAELVCTRCVPEPKYMILMSTTGALQPSKYGTSSGAPGRIRTCDARLRSPALYPLSYEGGAAGACPTPDAAFPDLRRCYRRRRFLLRSSGRRLPNLLVP